MIGDRHYPHVEKLYLDSDQRVVSGDVYDDSLHTDEQRRVESGRRFARVSRFDHNQPTWKDDRLSRA